MTSEEYMKNAVKTESCDFAAIERRMTSLMRVQHGAIGAANEAGELLGIIKKAIFYGKGMNRAELRALVRDEGGDVLWYLAILFHDLDLTFEEVMEANAEKLKARYGGGAFDPECVGGTKEYQCVSCEEILTVDIINVNGECKKCAGTDG